ncbi:P-loop containing nucleoside triphosphate hydrolases superfamily protein [Actinidia rufa]|uniref:P-loop containing nucleoside triphosphate hydrolases superfamily protein n=1 Tax=Actinidia rufa TaxID=165716 RepID=A0A7J0EW17_9ERIC|nr:P-loop containing nucleoside triphosphate hydrolases superfamily protein [Actinidia rufa]
MEPKKCVPMKCRLCRFCTEHEHLKKKHHEECEVLKKKYLEECSERKLLYNEVIELKGNIRVFCRCRPSNQDEIANGSTCVVDFDSSQENELQIICADSSRKQFKFDHVFRPEDNQDDVFVQTSPVVTSVLDGYNVCIFAYGQTGTGKTFTMEGTPENRGVNYRALEELFRISSQRSSVMRYELFVSMLEVYNEKIRDLLIENSDQPGKKLEIKQAADGVQEVPGLVEARVYGTDEVWELLKSGSRSRSVGSTNSNELSSRSHCLLRVTVKGESLINGKRTRSNLWLVDLAGSERLGKIEVEGGDCKTLMFVQISPNAADLGETICSLNFASRVRGIEHGPAHKQADPVELSKLKQLAEKAKHDEKEMKKLQDSLQSLQLRLAAREHICRSLQEKVRDLENQLAEERKIRQKQETRALAAVSAQSPALSAINQAHKTLAEKKPPLVPLKLRLPLRGITNFLPPPSSLPPYRTRTSSILPISRDNKENLSKMMMSATKSNKRVIKARRGSFVIRQPPPPTNQVLQPKRRASLATFRPETNSYMTTPLSSSNARPRTTGHVMGRQSFAWDPQRVWCASRVQSPMPRLREGVAATVMATPMAPRSSKFVGSPPTQVGSWRPKHPTVVALQKKHLVWSPLKLRGMRNSNRKSFLPS